MAQNLLIFISPAMLGLFSSSYKKQFSNFILFKCLWWYINIYLSSLILITQTYKWKYSWQDKIVTDAFLSRKEISVSNWCHNISGIHKKYKINKLEIIRKNNWNMQLWVEGRNYDYNVISRRLLKCQLVSNVIRRMCHTFNNIYAKRSQKSNFNLNYFLI